MPASARIPVSYSTGVQPESLLDLIVGSRCTRDAHLIAGPTLVDDESGAELGPGECGTITVHFDRQTTPTEQAMLGISTISAERAPTRAEAELIAAARAAGYEVRTPEA